MLYLTDDQVASLVSMPEVIDELERAFLALASDQAAVQPRQRVRIPGGLMNAMNGGWSQAGFGTKLYTGTRSGGSTVFLLFDPNNGGLIALMEARRLGQLRTGAASGLATKLLANPDASSVAVIGSGFQARTQLAAVCAARPIQHAWCYSRDAQRRAQFASELTAALGIPVEPSSDANAAVEVADIVITITSSAEPVFDGHALQPGTHINAAGINDPAKREIDAETVRRSSLVVVDLKNQAQIESGDLIAAARDGAFQWDAAVELAQLVAGKSTGRTAASDITLFESQGIALEDVAIAGLVYRHALERGAGKHITLS